MIERTLMRPRDIISFVNQCFVYADGKSEISRRAVMEAEREYSRVRLQALVDEWRSAFPTLNIIMNMLRGKSQSLSFGEISAKEIVDDIALHICAENKISHDPLFIIAGEVFGKNPISATLLFSKKCVEILYRVGVIGIKFDRGSRFLYSHIDHSLVDYEMVNSETRVRTHPMLHFALNIASRPD